jgi:putative two-component system response regulator
METIFIVDDSDANLIEAKKALKGHYRIFPLPSAEKMFTLLEKITPGLILLDIEMPEMDGFAALEKLKGNAKTAKIPVIFLTASTDEATEVRGFETGVEDFIAKPFSKPVLLRRIACHLHISNLIKKRTERIETLQNSIVFVLADMIENRDQITGGHVERTTAYVEMLFKEMVARGLYAEQMRDWTLNAVTLSARLHDVGKITISDLILNKPSELTKEEFEVIKKHTTEGMRIIDQIVVRSGGEVFLTYAKLFSGYHHERWDGTGYPFKLKGEDIPLQGRIMAIADVYDALVSERPYKKAFTHEEAVNIIMEKKGVQFDPKIAEVFFDIKDKFKEIKQAQG